MSDRSRHNRTPRLARAAAVSGASGKICSSGTRDAVAGSDHRARRPRGDSKATIRSRRTFSRRALAKVDPARVHDLHMVQSVIGAARTSGSVRARYRKPPGFLLCRTAKPQARRTGRSEDALRIGAIHTYLELYARMLVDLTPQVALVVADKADRDGNLYTGPNTEDTPTIVEAAAFRGGIVVAQVNEIVDRLPRVDIPGGLGRFRGAEPKALSDRSAVHARSCQDQKRERADGDDGDRRGIRTLPGAASQSRHRLCHGGNRTDPADLRRAARTERQGRPAFRAQPASDPDPRDRSRLRRQRLLLRLRTRHGALRLEPRGRVSGRRRRQSALEPRAAPRSPANMPATSSSAARCRSMRRATARRPPRTGSLVSAARRTWARTRVAGATTAPPGCAPARKRARPCAAASSWCRWCRQRQPNGAPSFVERLDAFDLAASAGFALPPVMIYGDDVSHVITERGVANLLRCRSPQEREAALRAVAGDTDFGRRQSAETTRRPAPPRHRDVPLRPRHRRRKRRRATGSLPRQSTNW